jgi:hypothetical protein
LVAEFRRQGYPKIRAVDIKPYEEWYQHFPDVEFQSRPESETEL